MSEQNPPRNRQDCLVEIALRTRDEKQNPPLHLHGQDSLVEKAPSKLDEKLNPPHHLQDCEVEKASRVIWVQQNRARIFQDCGLEEKVLEQQTVR